MALDCGKSRAEIDSSYSAGGVDMYRAKQKNTLKVTKRGFRCRFQGKCSTFRKLVKTFVTRLMSTMILYDYYISVPH